MTEKKFLFINFFCVKYFRFQFIFYVKTATPTYSKTEILSSSCFCKFGWRVTPSPQQKHRRRGVRGERGVHYKLGLCQLRFPFLLERSFCSELSCCQPFLHSFLSGWQPWWSGSWWPAWDRRFSSGTWRFETLFSLVPFSPSLNQLWILGLKEKTVSSILAN